MATKKEHEDDLELLMREAVVPLRRRSPSAARRGSGFVALMTRDFAALIKTTAARWAAVRDGWSG